MRKLLCGAAAIPLFAAAALAQNASPPSGDAGPAATPPGTMENQPAAGRATTAVDVPGKGPRFISVPDTAMLTGNVVGLDVYDSHNNDLGKIHDVVLGPDRSVKGYILSVGGFLGMGTHYVAVDPGAVAITYDDGNKTWRAAMNAAKDQLKSAPEFKYDGRWNAGRS